MGLLRRPTPNRERGAIAVLAAFILLVMGGFLALSINTGHKMTSKAQLQAAYDSGGLAGAMTLDGTTGGVTAARTAALTFATAHGFDGTWVRLGASDVSAGYWDRTARRFFPEGSDAHIGDATITLDSTRNPQFFNAVRVLASADGAGSHNNELDVWFRGFTGGPTGIMVTAGAVGIGGGPCEESGCVLPLVIPACAMTNDAGVTLCGTVQTMYFDHGQGKQIALADITQPSRNVDNFEERTQMGLGAACITPRVNVGDTVAIGNGDDFTSHVDDAMRSPHNIVCTAPAPYTGC